MQTAEIESFLFCEADGDGHWAWVLSVAVALAQVFVGGQLEAYLPNNPTPSCHMREENIQLFPKMVQGIGQLAFSFL